MSSVEFYSKLEKRPLVPIAVIYICGIIFAKYIFVPCEIIFAIVVLYMIYRKNQYGRILFYLLVFLMGCAFYQLIPEFKINTRFNFVREYIRKIIYYNVPTGDERNLLAGLFLGERQNVSDSLVKLMRNTNTIHILAISGDHIGFIGLILVGVFRLINIPRKVSALIALICIFVYVSMIGWQAPTFRAAVMFGTYAVGWILDRPSDNINTLSLAALIILLVNPSMLFQAGFQLSFVIVLVLIMMMPEIRGGYLKKTLLGSAVAWVGCMPLVAFYFQIISPISIIANLVMVTGISLVLAIGFTSILSGMIYIGVSGIFNAVNYFIVKTLIGFLALISKIPFGYFYIEDFPVRWVFISYLVIGIVFLSLSFRSSSVVE